MTIDIKTLETHEDQAHLVAPGTTAFEAISQAHDVEWDEFAGLGKLITSIDGNAQDENHYWIFFIDGEPATVGVDSYVITEPVVLGLSLLSGEESAALFEDVE